MTNLTAIVTENIVDMEWKLSVFEMGLTHNVNKVADCSISHSNCR